MKTKTTGKWSCPRDRSPDESPEITGNEVITRGTDIGGWFAISYYLMLILSYCLLVPASPDAAAAALVLLCWLGVLGLRLSCGLDLSPELRALPVKMESFLAVGAAPRPELLRCLKQRFLWGDLSVCPSENRARALALKPRRLSRSLSISRLLLLAPQLSIHLRQPLPDVLGEFLGGSDLANR